MKILMRGATDPLQNMEPSKFIIENRTGGNVGNMLFTNAISKVLLVDDDTSIDYIDVRKVKRNRAYADYVNENYDCFLIPLANAFKWTGHEELKMIADFVKMLKIPCCIIGVGIQSFLTTENFKDIYPYNDDVKDMIKSVLEKSPIIGVRGEATAHYLTQLGFIPEKDFTVIGCPSMFTYGAELPKIENDILTQDSVVAFNSKIEFEGKNAYEPVVELFKRSFKEFPNYVYIQQQIDDVRMTYLDSLHNERRDSKIYDLDKAVAFTNVPSWINYFKNNVDFSFGSRIHGNVAAILGGVPAVAVPYDWRVYELCDYHNIPMIKYDEIDESTNLYDIFEKADFSAIYRGHKERFDHYIDFLHTLGLDTIYDHKYEGDTPYEKTLKSRTYPPEIRAYGVISDDEKIERYKDSFILVRGNEKTAKENLKNKKAELSATKKELKDTKKELKAANRENKKLQRELNQNPFKLFIKSVLKKLGIDYKRKNKPKSN